MKAEENSERFYAPGSGLQQAAYFWIFPNLMLNIYPDNISTNLIVPIAHDKTLTIFEWFFHDVADAECKNASSVPLLLVTKCSKKISGSARMCSAVCVPRLMIAGATR